MLPENKQKKTLVDLIDDAMVLGHARFISGFEKAGIDREFVVKPLYAFSTAGFMIPGLMIHKSLLVLGLFPSGRMFYTIPPQDKLGNFSMYCIGAVAGIGGQLMLAQTMQQNNQQILPYAFSAIGMGLGALGMATGDYFRKAPQPKL